MEICAYVQPGRLRSRSGVPRHVRAVLSCLWARSDVTLSLLGSRREMPWLRAHLTDDWLAAPTLEFPGTSRVLQGAWSVLGAPSYEQLGGDADWVYSPADAFVATRGARFAGTIHDLYKLEAAAPRESRLGHYAARLRLRSVYAALAKRATVIFTVSQFTADRIVRLLGVDACRVQVIHNGVGSAFLRGAEDANDSPLKIAGLETGGFLLHVGGLTAKKNAHTLLAMWERGEWWRNGYKLVLVGNHHAPYYRLASTLPGVMFIRDISDTQLARLYRQSAALVLPSWYEGFGIPVIEGMGCAVPMVLSDIPAFREVAVDYAHFAPPGDTEKFVSIVDYLLSGRCETSELSQAGRGIAARYTWDACAARIVECLSSMSPCR